MAEAAAINLLFETAKNVGMHYYGLISGGKQELLALNEELDKLKALAVDVSQKDTKSTLFKDWLVRIKDLILDVEDTIASCAAQAEAEGASSNWIYKKFNCRKVGLAEEVKDLRQNRIKRMYDDTKWTLETLPLAVSDISNPDQQTSKEKKEKDPRLDKVITLEKETEALVKDLTTESENFEVFSIAGMPGLGKTTLAWKLCHDPRIRNLFPIVIWVSVSQVFNKENVLQTILETSTQDDLSAPLSRKSSDELSKMVRTSLERGRFLIFLDDVWTTDAWKEIKSFLPTENKQGKVLITTRINQVAAQTASPRNVRGLRLLDLDESWKLLQLEVFGNLDDCPEELKGIGKDIAAKCDGLPFAIVVIGGVLSGIWEVEATVEAVEEKWEEVFKTVEHYLIGQTDKNEGLRKLVSLSYNSLSPELKDCFLYLGMFPEDTEIPIGKLTQLWIGEGFVNQERGRSLEEIAQTYVRDLIDKNLVMAVKVKPDGTVKTCRVHDVILQFCEMESAHLFQEIRSSSDGFEPGVDKLDKYRRLCIHSSLEKFLMKKPEIPKARSFVSFSKETMVWEKKKELPSITEAFNLLRILDVNMAIKFPKFPKELHQLVLLKYVTLSSDELNVLPKDIHKLLNVQTLEVYTSSPTLTIKANIWKMKQLRHFKSKASIILSKGGKGDGGDNLRTFKRLSPQSCTDEVFRKATNLKVLGIRGELSKLLDSESSVKELDHLEKLKLINGLSREESVQKPLRELPVCEWFPKNVKILVLSATNLEWNHMSTLGKLGSLEVLKLKDNAVMGDLWNADGSGFNRLKSLHVSDTDLVMWSALGEAFMNLRNVWLINCKELKGLPDELVMRLKVLYMERVGAIAVSTAKKLEKAIHQQEQGKQSTKKGGFKLVRGG